MKKDKSVSAVIGVILMVAITVAIAGTVYFYISSMLNTTDLNVSFVVEGEVDYIYERGLDNKTILIIDHTSYHVENDLDFFHGIEKNDLVRFYFSGDYVDDWEFII